MTHSIRAIILAAGDGTRWRNHLGAPKHFATVDGEPILHRTVRLLREHGVTDVRVVASDPVLYATEGATVHAPDPAAARYRGGAAKFLDNTHHWNTTGRTILVYGDVFFTTDAIARITAYDGPWRLFCRFGPSRTTGGKYAECFAISFPPSDHERWRAALEQVAHAHEQGVIDRCGGWEAYRAMNGRSGRDLRHRSPQQPLDHHEVIDDFTDDFDSPADYERFVARYTP